MSWTRHLDSQPLRLARIEYRWRRRRRAGVAPDPAPRAAAAGPGPGAICVKLSENELKTKITTNPERVILPRRGPTGPAENRKPAT
jgi:hypothetical protein